MSIVIGYICSNNSLTPGVTELVRPDFESPEQQMAAGFGWIKENRSLLKKEPAQSGGHRDPLTLMSDIPSRSLVGHIETENRPVNTPELQPFGYRTWVYSQSGGGDGLEPIREQLSEAIPDHIFRNIEGQTMAEVVFHRFMTLLREHDGSTTPTNQVKMAATALADTCRGVKQLLSEETNGDDPEAGQMKICAASERILLAANTGQSPLYYRFVDGIEREQEEPLFSGHKPKRRSHPHFKAVFVSNAVAPSESEYHWKSLAKDEVLWVDRNWDVETATIDSLLEAPTED